MYYFLVNEHGRSGMVKTIWHSIKNELNSKNVEFKAYLTKEIGHATKVAKRISEQDEKDVRIVVVGGDGTFNEVVNGIVDFKKLCVGLIPVGSANDFANGMGIPLEPLEALNNIISCKESIKTDLGRVTFSDGIQKLFAISAGIGVDALVCKKNDQSNIKRVFNKVGAGDKSYVAIALSAILTCEQYDLKVEYDNSQSEEYEKAFFLAAMNVSCEGGGVKMAPKANAFDGMLTTCCGYNVKKIQVLPSFAKILAGKHEGSKEFSIRDFKSLRIEAEKPMMLHTDGEYCGEVSNVSIECLPGIMNFIM